MEPIAIPLSGKGDIFTKVCVATLRLILIDFGEITLTQENCSRSQFIVFLIRTYNLTRKRV